jgi:uncharacterized LabA/DUF88 family protein
MDRVAIFIDAGNMFYAQKENNWWIDWRRALQYFTDNRYLYGAYYFTAMPPPERNEKLQKYRKFRKFLIASGYKVVDKEVRTRTDPSTGQLKEKGNLDIELVFHMMVAPEKWDEAVVFGCDVDYAPILEHLRNIGKKIKVVGIRKMTSLDLINAVSEYVDLNEIRSRVEKGSM